MLAAAVVPLCTHQNKYSFFFFWVHHQLLEKKKNYIFNEFDLKGQGMTKQPQLLPPQPSSSLSDYFKHSFNWTAWSQWSMMCDSECRRSRRRECKPGYLSPSGGFVFVTDDNLDPMVRYNKCKGMEVEYSECTFICVKDSRKHQNFATFASKWRLDPIFVDY
jgi:hypothetical protein